MLCYANAGTPFALGVFRMQNRFAQDLEPFPFLQAPFRVVAKRVLGMMTLWMIFGLVVGSNLMPGNLISMLSGAIAGGIILPGLGLFLGLMGGPVKECLFGAL